MSKGIPITSRRGVPAVALVLAGVLGLSAYLFATTGWGTPFPGCWPPLSRPVALLAAGVQVALAVGFVVAALWHRSGPTVKDPLLISLVLALIGALAVGGGAHTFATGVARFGRSGCLDVAAPWSYGPAAFSILVGALALGAAAMVAVGRGD